MRGFAIIFIGMFLWLVPSLHCAGRQIDSTRLAALDARLDEYFRTLEPERIDVKNKECDLLVDSATDSVLRRHIALKIYDHYLESPVMGDEAVAIHMTDTWFATGLIDMGGDEVLLNAKVYADFNRQSLLGMQAPVVEMETPEGAKVEVGGPSARYRVLFFYDTECSKCKLETILLRSKLNTRDWPIDVYAVYTGVSAESWKEWRESKFAVRAPETKVIHLWDPEVASDYQMKYGVIQTPRMFLIDRSGTIIGRGVDTRALDQLLGIVLADSDYEYGSPASMSLIDNLFASYRDASDSLSQARPEFSRNSSGRSLSQPEHRHGHSGRSLSLSKRPTAQNVLDVARILETRTLSKGDTTFFKHLEGDLLYWLSSRREEAMKEGAVPFINEYILSRPEIWNTPDDTLKVVGLARMMKDLLSRTPVGSKLPKANDLVSGRASVGSQSYTPAQPGRDQEQVDSSDNRDHISIKSRKNDADVSLLRDWTRKWNRVRGKGGYIVFHTEGCPVCKSELSAADSLGLKPLDVNVDEIMLSNPDLAKALLDTFDLSSMPLIIEVDRHGIIRRRYLSFIQDKSVPNL